MAGGSPEGACVGVARKQKGDVLQMLHSGAMPPPGVLPRPGQVLPETELKRI